MKNSKKKNNKPSYKQLYLEEKAKNDKLRFDNIEYHKANQRLQTRTDNANKLMDAYEKMMTVYMNEIDYLRGMVNKIVESVAK